MAPADMLFMGVAFSGTPMPTPNGLSYMPATDGCSCDQLSGVPVLLDHRMEAAAAVGAIECAWLEFGMLHVIVRLAKTDPARQIWLAIEAGALQGLSFTVNPLEAFQRDGIVHVPKWAPVELSICVLGWDAGAKIDRSHDNAAILKTLVRETEKQERARAAAVRRTDDGRIAFMERIATVVARDLGVDPELARESARRFAHYTDPSLASALAACVSPHDEIALSSPSNQEADTFATNEGVNT